MLKSSETSSAQKQHNQIHCDISTNTLSAKFKPIPKESLTKNPSKPHKTLSRERTQSQKSAPHINIVLLQQKNPILDLNKTLKNISFYQQN